MTAAGDNDGFEESNWETVDAKPAQHQTHGMDFAPNKAGHFVPHGLYVRDVLSCDIGSSDTSSGGASIVMPCRTISQSG
jgi:hypothetical protein